MKRFAFLVVVVAALAGAFYWVRTHYDGDVSLAWVSLRSSALALVGQAPRTDSRSSRGACRWSSGIKRGVLAAGAKTPVFPSMTAVAQNADLPITRASVGWVEPIATVTVRARIEGEMVERRVQDGQMVKEGDVLFRLDDREIQAQIARDEARLVKDQATAATKRRTTCAASRSSSARGRRRSSSSTWSRPTRRSPRRTWRRIKPRSRPTASSSATPSCARRSPAASAWCASRKAIWCGRTTPATASSPSRRCSRCGSPSRCPSATSTSLRAALARKERHARARLCGGSDGAARHGPARLRRLGGRHSVRHGHGQGDVRQQGRPALARPVRAGRGRPRHAARRHDGAARRRAAGPGRPFVFVVKPDNTVERRPGRGRRGAGGHRGASRRA